MLKNDNAVEMITAKETDLLQEIMNIAFGRAASDLAEYIDIFVILSVPHIKLLQAFDLPEYINKEIILFPVPAGKIKKALPLNLPQKFCSTTDTLS